MSASICSGVVPETIAVPLAGGHTLEVDIYAAPTDTHDLGAQKIAVLCHPWSWLGGCKDDPVLKSIAITLNTKSNMHVFVPNGRSVGNSTGRASFSGKSEAADLEELTQWCVNKIGNTNYVAIVGYSHGSLLASCHPVLPESIQTYHILLSYPLSPLPLLTFFNASMYRERLSQLVHNPQARVLILFGDKDQFTGISNYQSWADNLQRVQHSSTSEAVPNGIVQAKMIPGADHFWRGRFNQQMTEAIINWLEKDDHIQRSTGKLATMSANHE
ncbi:unnamed protein product [Rhizoctonia solani]|uniref:AB hydrolase-1 domain-containing protein n=1 Tax=Rhizoctonia solani TaxID=456999 RepID=A0A8H3AFZ1_9AGAM|nr:unnamed protein product [Rhizoctonia solani]